MKGKGSSNTFTLIEVSILKGAWIYTAKLFHALFPQTALPKICYHWMRTYIFLQLEHIEQEIYKCQRWRFSCILSDTLPERIRLHNDADVKDSADFSAGEELRKYVWEMEMWVDLKAGESS